MRGLLPTMLVLVVAALTVLAGCPAKPGAETPSTGGPRAPAVAGNTANADAAGATDPRALFETKCKLCHSLEKATHEKLDRAGWDKMVKDMAAKKAGWISDTEAATIVQYLVTTHGK